MSQASVATIDSISINSIADIIKEVLGESFVYRTSGVDDKRVRLDTAIRQDEEFRALYTSVLWDEFIPDGERTSNSKLSTLFTGNLTYVKRHGLVGARKRFHGILSRELFDCEVRHIENELIHLAARNRAHGSFVFNEAQMDSDENRKIDYIGAKNDIRDALSASMHKAFVPGMASEGSPFNRIYLAFSDGGSFTPCGKIKDEQLSKFIAVMLLLLALNLFEAEDKEYAEIIEYTEEYIKSSFKSAKKLNAEEDPERALTRDELARLIWWASAELEGKLCRGEAVTLRTVSRLFDADALSKINNK